VTSSVHVSLDLDARTLRVVETVYELARLVTDMPKAEASARKIVLPELVIPVLRRHLRQRALRCVMPILTAAAWPSDGLMQMSRLSRPRQPGVSSVKDRADPALPRL